MAKVCSVIGTGQKGTLIFADTARMVTPASTIAIARNHLSSMSVPASEAGAWVPSHALAAGPVASVWICVINEACFGSEKQRNWTFYIGKVGKRQAKPAGVHSSRQTT